MLRGTKSLTRQQIQDQLDKNRRHELTARPARPRLARRPARDPAQVPARGARPAPPGPPRADPARRPARDPQDRAARRLRVVPDRAPGPRLDQAPADPQPLPQGRRPLLARPSRRRSSGSRRRRSTRSGRSTTTTSAPTTASSRSSATSSRRRCSRSSPRPCEGWHAKRPYARIEKPHKAVGGGTGRHHDARQGEREAHGRPDRADEGRRPRLSRRPDRQLRPGRRSASSSRLADRLRQKDGLSYGAGSMFTADAEDENATLMVFAIFNPANLAKVEAGVREEFDRLLRGRRHARRAGQGPQGLPPADEGRAGPPTPRSPRPWPTTSTWAGPCSSTPTSSGTSRP